ncbi:MAG: hypothetical protein N0E37_04620 [Candidatus Thiodiazotropha taylori]|nr:hypothetical protein [Candidatus Thiodiazotropha taylori]MCW4243703.1 hypothetical protein [Candidatus Thiodiazotropha taylori]
MLEIEPILALDKLKDGLQIVVAIPRLPTIRSIRLSFAGAGKLRLCGGDSRGLVTAD